MIPLGALISQIMANLCPLLCVTNANVFALI